MEKNRDIFIRNISKIYPSGSKSTLYKLRVCDTTTYMCYIMYEYKLGFVSIERT